MSTVQGPAECLWHIDQDGWNRHIAPFIRRCELIYDALDQGDLDRVRFWCLVWGVRVDPCSPALHE